MTIRLTSSTSWLTSQRNVASVTREDGAECNQLISLEGMVPCNQEEGDSRLFLHARHAVEGHTSLSIKECERGWKQQDNARKNCLGITFTSCRDWQAAKNVDARLHVEADVSAIGLAYLVAVDATAC